MANTAIEIGDDLIENLLLATKVHIESSLSDTGRFSDFDDRRVVVTVGVEHLFGRIDQLAPGACPFAFARLRDGDL